MKHYEWFYFLYRRKKEIICLGYFKVSTRISMYSNLHIWNFKDDCIQNKYKFRSSSKISNK